MPEYTDSEKEAIHKLAEEIYGKDPMEFQRLAKKHIPDMRAPFLDLEERVAKKEAELDKKIKDFEDKRNEDKWETYRRESRKFLEEKEGWSKEDVAKLEERMKADGITRYDYGMKLFERENKSAEPTAPIGTYAPPKPKDMGEHVKTISDARQESRKIAHQMIEGFKAQRRY